MYFPWKEKLDVKFLWANSDHSHPIFPWTNGEKAYKPSICKSHCRLAGGLLYLSYDRILVLSKFMEDQAMCNLFIVTRKMYFKIEAGLIPLNVYQNIMFSMGYTSWIFVVLLYCMSCGFPVVKEILDSTSPNYLSYIFLLKTRIRFEIFFCVYRSMIHQTKTSTNFYMCS